MTNTSDENNYQIKLAIRVIIGRDKAAPDSFELFKAFTNLARTSKAYNNLLDELLITLSCRCIRGGGCRFARNKLYSYIRTSNTNKFISCADQILQTYHSSVYNPIFTKCLIDIVKNSNYEFLASYIKFLTSRSIVVPCQQFYVHDKPRLTTHGKYPGFKPRDLVTALQISNENGWTDKALLLFEHLMEYYTREVPAHYRGFDKTEEIRAEISKNNKLNFAGQLANELNQAWRNAHLYHFADPGPSRTYLSTLIAPKRMEISKVPKEVFDLPIHLQPWFFGHVESYRILADSSADESFFVTFHGSQLFKWEKNKPRLIYSPDNLPKFYLSRKEEYPNHVYLYQFYCSLQDQDLDAMKSIQETHNIKWSQAIETLKQPNPILELLKSTSTPNSEVIQYMIDIGVPTTLVPWHANREVRDDQLTAINMLLSAGAKIATELVIELLKLRPFMGLPQIQRLLAAWDQQRPHEVGKIIEFALYRYQPIYKENKIINDRILTVLWIHKFGKSDTCNYLQTLPKELIKVILDFLNEPPLFYQLASVVMKIPGMTAQCRVRDFYRSPLIGQLVLEAEDDEVISRGIYILNAASYKILRQNYYWIRRAICERPRLVIRFQNDRKPKLFKDMMKNEKDITIFRHLHRHQFQEKWPFVDAFKTQNIAALRYFIEEQNTFEMPSRTEFEALMKRPKYTITYEQALALIEQIKAKKN